MSNENIATITDNVTCTVTPVGKNSKKAIYQFKNNAGHTIGEYEGMIPASLTSQSSVSKFLKHILDPDDKLKPSVVNQEITNIKELLQLQYDNTVFKLEEEKNLKLQEESMQEQELLTRASSKLQSLHQPLIYIGSLVDWLTAGERLNIIYTFVVYAGQVILNNPISVIGLGEASSGKSHIQTVAMSLIPKQFIVNEKKITEPALFNRAKKDPYFYDGKIVNYGDMGGTHDHEFADESKNLMKELQSDGFLNKPLSVPDGEGGWTVKDLTLYGKPCLTYTTVPNHKFDDQEESRSVFITPRMDNKTIYDKRNSIVEFSVGKTAKKLQYYENEVKLIPYMILHLKQRLKDTIIINPYVNFVNQFLSKSKYYKRDFPKYNGLLKTITALNYYNNFKCNNDEGQEILFTSINDVQLFISLLKPYHESISANITPKAVEVLNDIREHISEWTNTTANLDGDLELDIGNKGITTNDYFAKSELGLSKDSVKKYIYELHENGYLRIVGRDGRSNIYNLAVSELVVIHEDLKQLSKTVNPILAMELGDTVAVKVKEHEEYITDLDIMNQDSEVEIPVWLK